MAEYAENEDEPRGRNAARLLMVKKGEKRKKENGFCLRKPSSA